MPADKIATNDFLARFRKTAIDNGLAIVRRSEYMDALALLNWEPTDAKNAIIALTEDCYVSGPDADHDGSEGEIWVFGVEVQGHSIYIKLKLDNKIAKCISFHIAERPMHYPLK